MTLDEITSVLRSLGVYLLDMAANPLNQFYEITWHAHDPMGSGDYRQDLNGTSKATSLELAFRGILSDLVEDENLPLEYRLLAATSMEGA